MALFLNSTRCPKNNNMFESSLKQYFLCMRRQFLYFFRLGCRCIVLYIFFASKELQYYSFLVSRLSWVIIQYSSYSMSTSLSLSNDLEKYPSRCTSSLVHVTYGLFFGRICESYKRLSVIHAQNCCLRGMEAHKIRQL